MAPCLPQDAALRKKVDERRQDAELRREFAAVAAREERERQWRIAKGQATAADLAGPVVAQPVGVQRETWMTELPPERSEPTAAAMPTVSGVGEVKGRGPKRVGLPEWRTVLRRHHLLRPAPTAAACWHGLVVPLLPSQQQPAALRCPPLPCRARSRASQRRAYRAGATPAAGQ